MAKYKLKRKLYTIWDETDNLKRMKDSDILAEKTRPTTNYGDIALASGAGAAAGVGAGAVIGGVRGMVSPSKGKFFRRTGRGIKSGAGKGLVLGGMIAGALAYRKGRKRSKENAMYNERLKYAQYHARRRERKDWVTNMTQRDGYSY